VEHIAEKSQQLLSFGAGNYRDLWRHGDATDPQSLPFFVKQQRLIEA